MASVSLSDFLSTCNLKSFIDQFVEEGITRIEDIEDLTSSKLADFGFSETQTLRLFRYFNQWKSSPSGETVQAAVDPGQSAPETEIQDKVMDKPEKQGHSQLIKEKVSVPLGQGFFNKLGGSGTAMDKNQLKKLYKGLWYENPNTLKHKLSNSFILEMTHSRFTNFKTQRELEAWARKEREARLEILFAVHDLDDRLARESAYFKNKNILWQMSQLKLKYPVVNAIVFPVSRANAEFMSLYVTELKPILNKVNSLLEKCQSAFDSTFSSQGNVPQSNKEANNFYQKVLKRMTRVKSTVVAEVERIEEIMRNLPEKQQADLAKAVATRKTKYNKRKDSRRNRRDALKKRKIENSPDSQEHDTPTESGLISKPSEKPSKWQDETATVSVHTPTESELISKPSENPSKQQDETATVSVDQSSDITSEDDYGKKFGWSDSDDNSILSVPAAVDALDEDISDDDDASLSPLSPDEYM